MIDRDNKENQKINSSNILSGNGNVKFYCNNKRIIGQFNFALILTYFLILIPTILFYSIILPNFTIQFNIALYIITILSLIFDLITLYDVSSSPPGYLKKDIITFEEFQNRQEIIIIKDNEIELKYCETCKNIRKLRSFHCNICGYCIDKHDHHCPWVGNCIGKDNIKKFFLFLFFTFIHASLIFSSCLYFFFIFDKSNDNYYEWIINIILISFTGIIIILMLIGLFHQAYLISHNITTNECIRSKLPKDLFDKGIKENCKEVFLI